MRTAHQQGPLRHFRLLAATAVVLGSLIVTAVPGPVSANGGGGGGTEPAPSGQRTGDDVFSFVADDSSCESMYADLDVPVEVSSWSGSSWSLETPAGFPVDELLSASDTPIVYTGTVLDTEAQPVPNAIVGTLMLSNLPAPDASSPEIVAATCAVTNAAGQFSVRALNVADNFATPAPTSIKLANLGVSPPLTSASLDAPTLGSTSVRLTPASSALVNFTLQDANVNWGSYVYDQQLGYDDYVTFPTSAYCVQDPTPTTGFTVCGVSRGLSVSQPVTHFDVVSYDLPIDNSATTSFLRLYLDNAVNFPLSFSFDVSGFTEPMAVANGRWANAMSGSAVRMIAASMNDQNQGAGDALLEGSAPGDVFIDVPLGSESALNDSEVAKTSVSGVTFETDVWRNALTIPETTADTVAITAYHRHFVGSPSTGEVMSSFRYFDIESDESPDGQTAYQRLTGSSFEDGLADSDFFTTVYQGGGGGGGGGGGCGQAGTGNVAGMVVTSLDPVAAFADCGYLDANLYSDTAWGGGPGWDWQQEVSLSSSVDENGHFGFDVPATGVYRLQFRPNSSTEIPTTYLVARFTVSDGSLSSVETCASFSLANDSSSLEERCTSDWVTATPSNGRYLLHAQPGNLFGQALTPDSQPLDDQAYANVYTERMLRYVSNWAFSGDGTGGSTATDGKFIFRLSDGYYRLTVESPQGQSYAALRAYLRVSGRGSTVQRCTTFDDQAADAESAMTGCTTLSGLSWASPLQLQFTSGDLTGRVSGASYFWVEVQQKSDRCPTCYQQIPGGNANANNAGTFSLTFDEEGDYKLFLNPPNDDTTGATRSEVLVNVTIEGDTKTLVVTQNGSTVTPVNGIYDFAFNTANFVVLVGDPSGTPLANSFVNVQKLEQQGENFNFNVWVDSARSGSDGKARMSLTSSGYYKLVASNPTSDPYPELAAYVKVVGGGTPTFFACSSHQNRPIADRNGDTDIDIDDALVCDDEPLSVSNATPFPMTFQGADFRGQVNGSGNFWVEIQRLNTTQCEECYEWVGGTVANQNGIFGINFDSAGTYKLSINPPWNDTSGATRTDINVVVSGTSPDFDYVVTRGVTVIEPTDGTYLFSLSTANFAAVVRNGGSAEPYPNASFERWNTEYLQFQWSSVWANGNASGQFSTSLADGLWKVTARPGHQSEGTATPAAVYVVIENGEVSAAGVATSQACAQSAVLEPCTRLETEVSGGVSRYVMSLGTPNFSGYVTVASNSARDGSGVPTSLSDAVAFSWIEVQAWNDYEQQYRWTSEVSGINTSSNGRFASTLPAGNAGSNPDSKYLVIVNARPQDAAAGRSRGSFRVRVEDGVVVCDAEYAFCDADEAPAAGRFDLSLSGANVTGEVRTGAFPDGGDAVVFGQVRAERWNGQWFEWSNLWAQTGANGRFALNLETAGIYKITSEAPSWNNAYAGFANVSSYVKFDGTNVCEVSDQSDESCNDTAATSIDLEVMLVGANVRGTVRDSSAGVVRNSWINVQRYNSVLGWWEWVTGAPVNSSGAFSLSLAPSADGDQAAGGTQQRFKLEVMPPWGSSTLTRKEVQLWVGDVGQASGSNYYRVCDEASMGTCSGDAATPRSGNASPADSLDVVLTAGNLGGTVTTNGVTGMSNAWINVEKWTTPSWAREPMWQWVEVFANANQLGVYNMDLEPQGAGYYRITANPGWNNPDNLTRTSVVVYQNADGDVCSVDDPGDSDCGDAANPYSLDIQLAGANLVGTLKNGSDNVGFAWIGLMRERNNAGLDEDVSRTNTWYEWLGGSNTSASGSFGMRIEENGRYQLEVNPPWNTTLTRFSVYLLAEDSDDDGDTIEASEIRICSSKSESNDDCRDNAVWSGVSNSQISFPAANVAIRVCDKDDSGTTCTPVPNAWVNVFSGFEWVGGSNTNNLGMARFSLPDGESYRFEVNPNWANPDGSRVETASGIAVRSGVLDLATVDVEADAAVINKSSGQIDIRLGSPNVIGTVYYTNDLGNQTAMPWGYVGVRRDLGDGGFEWLPGAPVDGTGSYKLVLADGDYTLTAYPNPSVADRAPVSITASVVGGVASCTSVADACNIDFDGVDPNVVFTLTNMGTFTRALYVYDSANALVMSVSKTPLVGSVALSFVLGNGTYTLRVQALNTVAIDGTTPIIDFNGGNGSACRTFELVIAGNAVGDQPALDLWAGGFNGNDATTGLECA